jgi:hypothetical protein
MYLVSFGGMTASTGKRLSDTFTGGGVRDLLILAADGSDGAVT